MKTAYAERPPSETNISIAERLTPKKTPALGLQTYEYFGADKTESARRNAELEAFLTGDIDMMTYQYPHLFDELGNPISFEAEQQSLEEIIRDLRDPDYGELTDSDDAKATFESAMYRYHEIEFLKAVQQLNLPGLSESDRIAAADNYRLLNEVLYGLPDLETFEQLRGEVWSVIDSKELHPDAQQLRDELLYGFVTERGIPIRAFDWSEKRLPSISPVAAEWAEQFYYEEYGDYFDIVKTYWDEVIVPRYESGDGPKEFTGEDLLIVFQQALDLMDPKQTSGITIERKEHSGILSWNTPTQSVKVGVAERKTPVDSPEKAFAKLIHELVAWHGGRTKRGLKTTAPILGFGVYGSFDPGRGKSSDYLTPEEGGASLSEAILAHEITDDPHTSQWTAERVRLYANMSMAGLEGRDQREVYEITWRYTVLMQLKNHEAPTEEMIKIAKRDAAKSLERYGRSTPGDLPAIIGPIGYTKDISYLKGRVMMIPVIEELARNNDKQGFRNMLSTKTDPTDPEQREFAARHGYPVMVSLGK